MSEPRCRVQPAYARPRHWWAICATCRAREIWRNRAGAERWCNQHDCDTA